MNFLRATYGLLVCLSLSIFSTVQSHIQSRNKNTWIIFQDLTRIIFLCLVCTIKILVCSTTVKCQLDLYLIVLLLIAPIFDYLSILFLNIGFRTSTGFLLYSIIQLIVPMDMIYLKKFELKIIFLFFAISGVTFTANYFSHNEKLNFKKLILGILFGLLSNIALLICTYLQYYICLSIDIEIYYIYTTPIMIIVGFLTCDFRQKQDIKKFYRNNFLPLIFCGLFGTVYYFTGLLYVVVYEPYYFNISMLALTGFTGLIELPMRSHSQIFNFVISLLILSIGFFMLI